MIRRLAKKAVRAAIGGRTRKTPPAATAAPPAAATPAATAAPPAASPVETSAPQEAPAEVEIDHNALKVWVDEGRELFLLDIRESHEVRNGVLAGASWIPMNSVPQSLDAIPRDKTVIVYCAAGMRSFGVTHWLREQGVADAWSLVGGAGAGVSAGIAWQQEGPR